ncbi:TRAP transporter small permease subunit [Microvirga sp. W0021]|uniref:TRAP transporter small permease protein n=1 Tax=Hohaiivirga grylli TaxID=3133970 RepID=A0ABV0BI11_9HYPH
MSSLIKLSRGIDFITEWIGRIFAWTVFLATLVSAGNALLRYIFPDLSSNGLLELQWYLFGATFMLCAAWTWKNNGHVRIDVISSRLSPKARNWVELFCHFFFMLPFLAVMMYLTPDFVFSTYRSGEVSSSVGGLIVWPAKALIMAGFYVLGLQWISEVIKRIAIMRGLMPDNHAGHLDSAKEEADRIKAELASEDTAVSPGNSSKAGSSDDGSARS